MRSKKAEMGMGTLIIFIAMILVAAIAASVLISTTGALQNKALSTGKATTAEVGTSITAIEVFAEDGTDQSVDYWFQTLKISAGSDPIRFSDTLLYMNLDNVTQDYRYSNQVNCSSSTNISSYPENFGITYQISGTSNKNGYMNKGDVVKICFQSPRSVLEDEKFKLSLIPMIGSAMIVEINTPSLMINRRVPIYP